MLQLGCRDEVIALEADGFRLIVDKAKSQVATLLAGTDVEPMPVLADLFLLSSCNADGLPDYSYDVSAPIVRETADGIEVEITSSSSIWQSKKYVLLCTKDRLEYYYVVSGTGSVDDCQFFQGFVGDARRVGADKPWINALYEGEFFGRMRSKARFPCFFNPEPNGLRKRYFLPADSSTIGVRSNKSYCRGNWFFTPGPFCYVLKKDEGTCLALGLVTRPGENNFVEYEYVGGNGFGLSLRYEGKLQIDGVWESPHIVFFSAHNEYAALKRHSNYLYEKKNAAGNKPEFDWWREPIFCGWGQQCHLSHTEGSTRTAPSYATQENYQRFVEQLDQANLNPGIIIIDDKWQDFYGDPRPDVKKWPDLPGFIAAQHAAGRRVLLWLKAWDPEGVPPEECILDCSNNPVAVDPTNPEYEKRLRRCVRTLIGESGADGFKMDFTANLPFDGGQRSDRLWGVELLHHLIWIIQSEAKRVKKDALIIAHTVNPYFADVVDMVRLNDVTILPGIDEYLEDMIHRQKVARAVSPDWLIDTDNWPSPTLASWLDYIRLQPELGVPSLYYITHIDESGEEIGEAQWKEIAELWTRYRNHVGIQH